MDTLTLLGDPVGAEVLEACGGGGVRTEVIGVLVVDGTVGMALVVWVGISFVVVFLVVVDGSLEVSLSGVVFASLWFGSVEAS